MNGAPTTLTEALNFRGPVFVQFIFTTCGTICPVMTATLAGVQKRLGSDAGSVRMVSISIDPETDTPQKLRDYAKEFKAGPQWLFLTGTEANSKAAQRAFEVESYNKMEHRQITFLRPAVAGGWLRFEGAVKASDLAARVNKAGQRAYLEGVLPGGIPLRGQLAGGVELSGARAACVSCHRRSGMGATEGGTLVPPVTAEVLFPPLDPKAADIFGKLYEERQPAALKARVANGIGRPAYDERTFLKALRDGVDPAGRRLNAVMPRYRITDQDAAALTQYLKTLSVQDAPGVSEKTLHLATVVSDSADPARVKSMLDVMQAWVRRHNLTTRNELSKEGKSAWSKDDFYRAFREWELHVWKLEGPPEGWSAQLAQFAAGQPVFAILGGQVAGPWKPVGDFCDATATPCLFPQTEFPASSAPNGYTLYFSGGLATEAAVLGRYLNNAAVPEVGQISRFPVAAQAFRATYRGKIREGVVAGLPLVAWVEKGDLPELPELPNDTVIYGAGSLLNGLDRPGTFLTWPWSLPDHSSREESRVRGWLLARGVPKGDERVQFNTWYTMSLLNSTLPHLVENFSQDYLIEKLENEAEMSVNPGVYPRLALGPGQRFASHGAYLVNAAGEAVSDWIVP